MKLLATGILIGMAVAPIVILLTIIFAAWWRAVWTEVREIWKEAGYESRMVARRGGNVPDETEDWSGYRSFGGVGEQAWYEHQKGVLAEQHVRQSSRGETASQNEENSRNPRTED